MPVDSIITTTITRVMVRIRSGRRPACRSGRAARGRTTAPWRPCRKSIMPIAAVMTPPDQRCPAAPRYWPESPWQSARSAGWCQQHDAGDAHAGQVGVFGVGNRGHDGKALGHGAGTCPARRRRPVPRPAISGVPGWARLGAVGPTGLPKIQLMPTRIRLMPMTAMMVPVTTGGKKRSMRLTMGAIRMEMTPAPMTAPKIRRAPAWPRWPAPWTPSARRRQRSRPSSPAA
jgi:hypothetical protein